MPSRKIVKDSDRRLIDNPGGDTKFTGQTSMGGIGGERFPGNGFGPGGMGPMGGPFGGIGNAEMQARMLRAKAGSRGPKLSKGGDEP